jgi:glycosyltransferase involved in cell wall biosynthesis
MFSVRKNNSGLKIGIDATDITSDMFKGGIYHYIINLFSHLREIDTENQYIIYFNYLLEVHHAMCSEAMDLLAGKNMHILHSRFPRRLRKKLSIPVNFFIGKIDIFHGPFDNVLPVFGCKKITTIHDVRYFEVYRRLHELIPELADYSIDSKSFEGWNGWMNSMRTRVRKAVRRADHIITISQSSKNAIQRFLHADETSIHTVYNGISPLFRPVRADEQLLEAREKYGSERDYLLFVGHIDPFKNILRMLDAYSMVRNEIGATAPRLILISPTPERDWFYKVVQQKISVMSLQDDITILGNVPDQDLPVLYSGAEALLIPSLYEGFGLPAIEAMACGTPVIASNICSLPEVCGNAALLVDPYSTDSVAEGIHTIISDKRLRNELSGCGLNRAVQFSWEKTARETLKIYKQISQIKKIN